MNVIVCYVPGLCSGEGNGYPLQYSCLENSMERRVWWATAYRVAKSQTRLTDTYTHTHTLQACARSLKHINPFTPLDDL